VVEVPIVQTVDRIIERHVDEEVIKEVPKLDIQYETKIIPKPTLKVVPRYEYVKEVVTVDRPVVVPQVEEVVKSVPKIEVVEVPVEVRRTTCLPACLPACLPGIVSDRKSSWCRCVRPSMWRRLWRCLTRWSSRNPFRR